MKKEEKIMAVEGIFSNGVLYNKEGIKALSYNSFKRENPYLEGYFNLKWSEELNIWIIFQYVPEKMYHLYKMYYDITGRIGK